MRFLEEKLWPRVQKTDGCWTFKGGKDRYGYGKIYVRTHMLAYELSKGPIPKGFFVCHSCDNPACVNPTHLFLGTQQDNLNDMLRKGRYKLGSRPGATNGRAKLTPEQVAEIRLRYRPGWNQHDGNCSKLAREYGVGPSAILAIAKRKTWCVVK